MTRLVVIGGDAAGMSAASQARRRRSADELEIVTFERGRHTSFSACGIPYWIGGLIDDEERLVSRRPDEFRERQQIEVHLRHEVVQIDAHGGRVEVWDHDAGRARWEPYDELVLATGARPIRPSLPGIEAAGVFGVQTLDDGAAVHAYLDTEDVRRAVVVGGGYIGLEMAEAMVNRGIEVTVVTRSDHVMPTLDTDVAAGIATAMTSMGIRVVCGQPAEGFHVGADGRVRAVETADGTFDADLVFLGIGAAPEVSLAEQAGIPIGEAGGVVTDPRQHTAIDGIWAAGDCTQTFHRVAHMPVALSLGTIANKQGRVAGINIGGDAATFPGVLGTAITRVCALEIARTGLNERQCRELDLPHLTTTIRSRSRAGYMPDAPRMIVKVTVATDSGRLLGAQIVGGDGSAKRIDTFATALWNEMTVGDLLNVDLGYAPPFSGVWDPVLVAARKAWQALG